MKKKGFTESEDFEWFHFFNHVNEEEGDMITEKYKNPMINRAHDILKTMSSVALIRHRAEIRSEALRNKAIWRAGERKAGIEEGIKRGRKEGRKEQAEDIARKMLAKGVNINDVVDFTGLSVEDIDKVEK